MNEMDYFFDNELSPFLRTKANFYFVIWEFMNSSILIISKATPGMIERYFAAGQQVEKVCSINSQID